MGGARTELCAGFGVVRSAMNKTTCRVSGFGEFGFFSREGEEGMGGERGSCGVFFWELGRRGEEEGWEW